MNDAFARATEQPPHDTGGGDRGLWLQLLPEDLKRLIEDRDTFTKYLYPLARWHLGLPYDAPQGIEADFIFGKLKDQQLRSAEAQQKRRDGGKLTAEKRWRSDSQQVASNKQASSQQVASTPSSYPNITETETKQNKTETEPKPKEGVSDSGFDSVSDSEEKSAVPGGASCGRPSAFYEYLKDNLIRGILKIIGRENDQDEAKAWRGLLIKAREAGRSKEDMVDAVYSWYSALKVDGEPKNRAAALNRYFHKSLGLT